MFHSVQSMPSFLILVLHLSAVQTLAAGHNELTIFQDNHASLKWQKLHNVVVGCHACMLAMTSNAAQTYNRVAATTSSTLGPHVGEAYMFTKV